MNDGKRKEQMKERNEKKSKILNCQIGMSFVLSPSSLEQLSS